MRKSGDAVDEWIGNPESEEAIISPGEVGKESEQEKQPSSNRKCGGLETCNLDREPDGQKDERGSRCITKPRGEKGETGAGEATVVQ